MQIALACVEVVQLLITAIVLWSICMAACTLPVSQNHGVLLATCLEVVSV
jgi:hypothetical protein